MKKKQAKSLVNKTIDLALDILAFIVALTIDALTWVARKVWKRYFGIETPLCGIRTMPDTFRNSSGSIIPNGIHKQYE